MDIDLSVRTEETPEDSVVPVYELPLSDDEILERENWEKEVEVEEAKRLQKEQARENALSKLAESSGLTQEELSALLG